jgi:ketosteroid isomerase-like protein
MELKSNHWRVSLIAVILLNSILVVAVSSTLAQQDEVWSMEEKYWQYVQAGDVEKYLTLWHDDFVGWPCSALHPSRKANIGDWVRAIRDEEIQLTYELDREAIQYFGEVAVTHYSTPEVQRYPDGRVTGEGRLLKFTHTWMKFGDQWQIITGMCAPAEPI